MLPVKVGKNQVQVGLAEVRDGFVELVTVDLVALRALLAALEEPKPSAS